MIELKLTQLTQYFGIVINNKYLKVWFHRTHQLIYDDYIYVLELNYTEALSVFGDVYFIRNRSGGLEEKQPKKGRKSDQLSDMEQKRLNHLEQIPPEDWGKTPTSVKKRVHLTFANVSKKS